MTLDRVPFARPLPHATPPLGRLALSGSIYAHSARRQTEFQLENTVTEIRRITAASEIASAPECDAVS